MINPVILSQQVHNKLEKTCLTAIVTETFMRALPFTRDDVYNDTEKYTTYVANVMESLDCNHMLQSAMKAHSKNPNALNMLNSIHSTIESIVVPATKRIVVEAANQKANDMSDIVDKSAFTDDDKKKIMAASKDLNLKTISEIIKKKVIDTIKDEKDAYDSSVKLREDIKANLQDALGNDAPSLEAYFDTVLQKSDPRDHISFFSRLQDTCMESLICMETAETLKNPEDISIECLVNTTINSTLNCFDKSVLSTNNSLDILTKAVEAVENTPNAESKDIYAQKSLIMAIIITSIMETLKTMNLWAPSMAELRDFIDAPTALNTPAKNLEDKVHSQLIETKRNLIHADNNKEPLAIALGHFNEMKSRISAISEELLPNRDELVSEIRDAINLIEGALAKDPEEPTEGLDYYSTRAREANVAEFDRVARVMFRNPNIKKVEIVVDSSAPTQAENRITVKGLADEVTVFDQISCYIVMRPAFGSLIDEIKTDCKFSNMHKYLNQTRIYLSDQCRAISINDPM